MPEPLLSIQNLTIESSSKKVLVRNVSLDLYSQQPFALVGENGCGKTTLIKAIAGFLPQRCRVVSGKIFLKGQEITTLKGSHLRRMRGQMFSMILQNAMGSLTPSMRIGNHMIEAIRQHTKKSHTEAYAHALELLQNVNIPNPELCLSLYPFELSGGMRQRVVIAIALANSPEFILADEPTTALDTISQAQVLEILRNIQHQFLTTFFLVTHNLSLATELCKYVAIMRNGEIVEQGPISDIFSFPNHPYTQQLLHSVTKIPVYSFSSPILKNKLQEVTV